MKRKLVGALAALAALSSVVCGDSPGFPEVVETYDSPEAYLEDIASEEVKRALDSGMLYSIEHAPTLEEMLSLADRVYADLPAQELQAIKENLRENRIVNGTWTHATMSTVPSIAFMGNGYEQIIVSAPGIFDGYMTEKSVELFLDHEIVHVRDNYGGIALPSGRVIATTEGLSSEFALNLYEVRAFHEQLKDTFDAYQSGEVTQLNFQSVAASYLVTRLQAEECARTDYQRGIWNDQLTQLSEISVRREDGLYRLSLPDKPDIVLEIPPGNTYLDLRCE